MLRAVINVVMGHDMLIWVVTTVVVARIRLLQVTTQVVAGRSKSIQNDNGLLWVTAYDDAWS